MKTLATLALLFTIPASAQVLHLGDNVRVLAINGDPVASYQDSLNLPKGQHTIMVRYDALLEHDSDSHCFYRSDAHHLQFTSDGNSRYFLDAPDPHNEQHGDDLARTPSFELTDANQAPVPHNLRTPWDTENQF
ncbi:DUF2057 family protein [Ferrimonas aestuarii]|uniref:DUF2057 domain-containing protein n=1 Tax=Ferrimonas aestuarii TaxID=2569539 RepID=A0A4U1BFF5_9GAMM|nr:DUF2057 family protein [Ferrimonas aestuarii]TKB49646.1 DUF2057 domain-containing protein [Ferrimonas aestuarii]